MNETFPTTRQVDNELCAWQRICADPFFWSNEWEVAADHFAPFRRWPAKHAIAASHIAVQFKRRNRISAEVAAS